MPRVTGPDHSGKEIEDDAGRVWRQINDEVGTGAGHAAHAPGELRPVFDEHRAIPRSSAPTTPTPAPTRTAKQAEEAGRFAYIEARKHGASHSAAVAAATVVAKAAKSGASIAKAAHAAKAAVKAEKAARRSGLPKAAAERIAEKIAEAVHTSAPVPEKKNTLLPTTLPSSAFRRFNAWTNKHRGTTEHSPVPSRATQKPTLLQTLVPAPAAPTKTPVSDKIEYIDSGSKVFPPDYVAPDQESKVSPPVQREYVDDGNKVNFDAAQSFRSSAMHFLHAGTKQRPKTIRKHQRTTINDEESRGDESQESYFVKSRPVYNEVTPAEPPYRNEVTHGDKRTDQEPFPEDGK